MYVYVCMHEHMYIPTPVCIMYVCEYAYCTFVHNYVKCMYVCMYVKCMYVTFSHFRSKAQTVTHN